MELTRPRGWFRNAQNYKSLCPKVFNVCKILEMREKILLNSQTFLFVIVSNCTKRKLSQIYRATNLSSNRRWAQSIKGPSLRFNATKLMCRTMTIS